MCVSVCVCVCVRERKCVLYTYMYVYRVCVRVRERVTTDCCVSAQAKIHCIPECMYAVDELWHIRLLINIGHHWIEYL